MPGRTIRRVTAILPFHRGVLTATVDLYPEFRPFAKAVHKRDWATLSKLFDSLPPEVDRAYPIAAVTEIDGSEKFFARVVDSERSSSLPRVLLGDRYIKLAWKARGRLFAKYVSREQFQVFYEHLNTAERLLASVTADEPENGTAWSLRVVTARGLKFGAAESRRRYERVAAVVPDPIFAQRQMVQTLCPKWGGTVEDLVAFTRECVEAAPDGSMSAGLAVEMTFERMAATKSKAAFLRTVEVVEECAEAERRSTGHPAWRELPGAVITHSSLAYYWSVTGQSAKAHPHFDAIGRGMVFPWPNAYGDKLGAKQLRERSAQAKRMA